MSDLGNKAIFSSNLRSYIKKANMKNPDIAKELGYPYNTFLDWVNGNTYPGIDKIETLANYFNIKKSDLIEQHIENDNYSELDILYNEYKSILTETNKEHIKFIIEQRKKEIDKELDEK